MKKAYSYTVTGNGSFPNDMLRYDEARVVKLLDAGKYVVSSPYPPTTKRWESFGWHVQNVKRAAVA